MKRLRCQYCKTRTLRYLVRKSTPTIKRYKCYVCGEITEARREPEDLPP
ncbi:hypothetical protein LCGC14_0420570 [marine sediment metagenome]|uniref:Uncharacterized protein n=1 Tax=marine sediment metagenome TaxID=412755 RepID=A0A0F9W091_9ZZZZ